jgi:hypothetical protein
MSFAEIPYINALNFFLQLLALMPSSLFSFLVWALGLAGVWTVIYILLNNT